MTSLYIFFIEYEIPKWTMFRLKYLPLRTDLFGTDPLSSNDGRWRIFCIKLVSWDFTFLPCRYSKQNGIEPNKTESIEIKVERKKKADVGNSDFS